MLSSITNSTSAKDEDLEQCNGVMLEDGEDDDDDEVEKLGDFISLSAARSSAGSATDPLLYLRIKSFQDTEISVSSSSTVAATKQAVRRALKVSPSRYMRLIVRGRLLAPDTATLSNFCKDGDVVHAVIAAEGQQGGAQALLANSSALLGSSSSFNSLSRRALRGAGVTSTGLAIRASTNEEEEDETTEDDEEEGGGVGYSGTSAAAALIRHRGFDRLRLTMGLRRSQVAVLRAYFNPHVDRWARNNPERARQLVQEIDDALLRRRIHEEAWMATQGPGSEFRLNLSGGAGVSDGFFPTTSPLLSTGPGSAGARGLSVSVGTERDFFWGFMLGFFVGFLMLLWVWMPTVPHKQKLGILTGISFHLALSMLKSEDETDDNVLD